MKNFWLKLNKPIYALSPMAGITDSAFRQVCKGYGADVVYSELASATALFYSPKETLELLKFDEIERPYVAQLFGSNSLHFAKAVKIITETIKPDGIDINFGCPVPKVIKQGAGSALMNDLIKTREVVKSVLGNTDLPVSVKIRAKANDVDALTFLENLNDMNIEAVMIHGRTLSQGFAGAIDFEIIKNAREYFGGTILANGGIDSFESVEEALENTGADGVGIARGALGKPWIFRQLRITNYELTNREEIFEVALRHAKLAEKLKGKQGVIEMRKHLCWYVHGLPEARKMRVDLVKVESIKEIEKIFERYK